MDGIGTWDTPARMRFMVDQDLWRTSRAFKEMIWENGIEQWDQWGFGA